MCWFISGFVCLLLLVFVCVSPSPFTNFFCHCGSAVSQISGLWRGGALSSYLRRRESRDQGGTHRLRSPSSAPTTTARAVTAISHSAGTRSCIGGLSCRALRFLYSSFIDTRGYTGTWHNQLWSRGCRTEARRSRICWEAVGSGGEETVIAVSPDEAAVQLRNHLSGLVLWC